MHWHSEGVLLAALGNGPYEGDDAAFVGEEGEVEGVVVQNTPEEKQLPDRGFGVLRPVGQLRDWSVKRAG